MNMSELFNIDLQDIWMTHFSENVGFAYIKQAVDRSIDHFQLVKYDLRLNRICWELKCGNYKFWSVESDQIIVDRNAKGLVSVDDKSGKMTWEVTFRSLLEDLDLAESGDYELFSKPRIEERLLILQIRNTTSETRVLLCLDRIKGDLRWYRKDCNNIEVYDGKIFNLEFNGLFRILSLEKGETIKEVNLSQEFKKEEINCDHRFNVTKDYIYFKHGIKGKFGVLNIKSLKIEESIQLPEGNTLSTGEYPIPHGKRLYVRSAPQNNLFVYE